MTVFRLNQFKGTIPRAPDHVLREGDARVAHDIDVSKGTLAPLREKKWLQSAPDTAIRVHQMGCCTYTFDSCVDVAEWLPECPRLYITGRTSYPELGVPSGGCGLTMQRLGVPQPTTPLYAQSTTTEPAKDVSEVSYMYTFKNNLGEEGGPSPASNDVLKQDAEGVVALTGFYTPSFEYSVTTICVYRRETGFLTGNESVENPSTDYYLVAEYPVATRDVTDTAPIIQLGRALWTMGVEEPPRKLTNITAIGGTMALVASVGNKLYFSKAGQPWNWPRSQEMTLDDNIIDIVDQNGALYVLTTGSPYIVQGDGGCDERQCRVVTKLEYNMPLIACATGSGALATPFGVIYASNEGLIQLVANAAPKVLTDEFYTVEQWQSLRPDTTRLGYSNGMLFCVTDAESMVIFLNTLSYQNHTLNRLITISDRPVAMTEMGNGGLMMLENNATWQWGAGDTLREYHWRSEAINAGGNLVFASAQALQHNGVAKYTVMCDNDAYTFELVGKTSALQRLPRMGRHIYWWLDIKGTAEVDWVALASSHNALTRG